MADAGIKKVTIKMDELPPLGKDNNVILRYRIISEDRNRMSHWSPQYNLIADNPRAVSGEIEVGTKTVTVVWTDSGEKDDREAYDIFVKFDGGEYKYYGTSYVHGFSFLKSGTSTVSVQIQLEGIVKEINNKLKIYEGTEPLV